MKIEKIAGDLARVMDEKRSLELQEKALKTAMLEYLEKNKEDSYANERSVFAVARRPKWKYSNAIKEMEDKVKIAKIDEEEKGVAEKVITTYILVKEKVA